ncbi:MAG: alpha-ketoacid dehydrogenase subunit beta [Ruminococcaceae bacterium]|nr:alpha-ketoacid dehydrogenase subunit beta [Oscillospiraceae bacterium]
MAEMTGTKAFNVAMKELMEKDDKILVLGEGVGRKGGTWGYFADLWTTYGNSRMIDTPIAEAGFSCVGNGLAYGGYRPVIEYMFADFSSLGFDAIVNQAAKARYNSNGELSLPITFIMPNSGGGKSGNQHSQSVEAWYSNAPGLKIVTPTTPGDVRRFLKAAILDDDPVVFMHARGMMFMSEEVDETDMSIPSLANAGKIVTEGKDLTIVSWHRMLPRCLEAAAEVTKETGKTIEVIDPRVLLPFDIDTVVKSVAKTGKAMVVHEAPARGGFGMQVSAMIGENCLKDLKAPVKRIGGYNTSIPFGVGEEYAYPQVEDIKVGIMELLK